MSIMKNNKDSLGEVGEVGVTIRFNALDSPKHRQVAERWVLPTSPLGGV